MNPFISGGYILETSMIESEFIYISKVELPKRKTPIYKLYSMSNHDIKLGEIKWFGAWRQYCFFPEGDTVFDRKCLTYINNFLEEVNKKK